MEEDPIPSGSNIQLSTELNDGTWNKTKYPPVLYYSICFISGLMQEILASVTTDFIKK